MRATTPSWSRRTFLIAGLTGGVALRAPSGLALPLPGATDLGQGPCATATPRAVLAGASEPGTRLLVRGRLFAADGERPAAGAILYAYQTDATGIYSAKPGPPRLRGFMKTQGRFEYDTIRPGSYPGRAIAAHVHHQVWGGGFPAQWIADLNFADDPFVSAADRARSEAAGRFAWVLRPRREGGRLVAGRAGPPRVTSAGPSGRIARPVLSREKQRRPERLRARGKPLDRDGGFPLVNPSRSGG